MAIPLNSTKVFAQTVAQQIGTKREAEKARLARIQKLADNATPTNPNCLSNKWVLN